MIQNRSDSNRRPSIQRYAYEELNANKIDEDRAINDSGHARAPLAVFGLLHTVELDNGCETTYHHHRHPSGYHVASNRNEDGLVGPDRWNVAQVDYNRHRVVRQPETEDNDETVYILRLPDFSASNGVIGLDVDPVKSVWDVCYGLWFNHKRVLDESETKSFLQNTMKVTLVQVADRFKQYDGRNVTPGRDASITLWAEAEYGKKPIVVTTKNAIENFYQKKQPELLRQDVEYKQQYRGSPSSIEKDEPVILANGAPRPRNEEFQIWGAFQGESVPAQSNSNDSFGETGDKIRHQFMHSRVGRAVTNFKENGKEGIIILNTTAYPDWFPDPIVPSTHPIDILPPNGCAKRKAIRALRDQNSSATIKEILNETGISETSARRAVKEFEEKGWVIVKEVDEGKTKYEYQWEPNS